MSTTIITSATSVLVTFITVAGTIWVTKISTKLNNIEERQHSAHDSLKQLTNNTTLSNGKDIATELEELAPQISRGNTPSSDA